MDKPMQIGIIGCGNICDIYFKNLTTRFPWLQVASCSDSITEKAHQKAHQYNISKCYSTEEMLADEDIELVVNLTTPELHTSVNCMALEAGKHVYLEKPFAVTREEAQKTIALASRKKLHVGCAPDTFLGAGIQTCRRIIDGGEIGQVTSAMACMTCHGHESWHPNPDFYYQPGGGPLLDMGPYYLTTLVACIGPMKAISGMSSKAFELRTITGPVRTGDTIPVNTATHLTGTIQFENDALATMVMSFDIWKSQLPRIEIHGTKGSLIVPDPNTFGGEVTLFKQGDEDWTTIDTNDMIYGDNSRGLGVADMVLAVKQQRTARAESSLGVHVLDGMLALQESAEKGQRVVVQSSCKKPDPLPEKLKSKIPW